jgi:large subunit ribosomal protein L5
MSKVELKRKYKQEVVPELKDDLDYDNVMEVPKIEKVTVNVGYGDKKDDTEFVETVEEDLARITGQKPVHNKANQAISNFDIRKGDKVGVSVTLRGDEMYEFLYKLINLTLPRTKDFRGIKPNAFDKNGNYSLGLEESVAFPEVEVDDMDLVHGVQIAVTTSADNEEEGFALLDKLGFPFKDEDKQN